MASLTPANIVQTSSDLSSFDISSATSKQKIPSMYLLNELSANLTSKLERLGNILDLNEIKWLGHSSVHPETGRVVIDGIEYKNEDIDPGNYVTYTQPGTSATVKYIYGHGIWTNIGDIVYLPDEFVQNRHVNRNAQIALNKIGGLKLEDLQNSELTYADVQNLSTTLKAMIADYKKFDINQVFTQIEGQINNNITLAINGNTENLTTHFEQYFTDITGNVYNDITTNVDTLIGDLNNNYDQRFENIDEVFLTNETKINKIEGEIVNISEKYNQDIQHVSAVTINNSSTIERIEAEIATVTTGIDQKIQDVIGDVKITNQIQQEVHAQIAKITNTIQQTIKDSIIGELNIGNLVDQTIHTEIAEVTNSIETSIYNSNIETMTIVSQICSNVDATTANITNIIGTTFNDCTIGSVLSYDEAFYNALGSYSMHYCGQYRDLSAASQKLTEVSTCIKEFKFPEYVKDADGNYTISSVPQTKSFDVHSLNVGSVVRVGDDDSGWEFYMCTKIPTVRSSTNVSQVEWVPLVDNKVYIKRSNIQVSSELPAQLEDGMFYVIVDEE